MDYSLTRVQNRGVYVPNDDRWPEKFRGTGIRIEDSICVGDDNPIVLSPEAVKEVKLSLLSPGLLNMELRN